MRLGKVLKGYRWATKVGVRELAKQIGFSASTLSRIENGRTPSGVVLSKILRWLLTQKSEGGEVKEWLT